MYTTFILFLISDGFGFILRKKKKKMTRQKKQKTYVQRTAESERIKALGVIKALGAIKSHRAVKANGSIKAHGAIKAHEAIKAQGSIVVAHHQTNLSPLKNTIVQATTAKSTAARKISTIYIRRENVAPGAAAPNTLNTAAGVAAKKPSAAAGAATVAHPPIAPADLGNLIKANPANTPSGSPTCVGRVPAANRIVTDGTMVTGIIANNTVVTSDSRACDPSLTQEKNMNTGDSGVDSTWDYGK